MPVVRCKKCGGTLKIVSGETAVTCGYCGFAQSVPVADDDVKLRMFERAGNLLRDCEFNQAAEVYGSLIRRFPNEAEAYWCLVLCKYGIEYVDDPETDEIVPICHRASLTHIYDDEDYIHAKENADERARKLYHNTVMEIESEHQKAAELFRTEKPFDIFICHKETSFNGERTLDSFLAEDLYDALAEKGYRVFYSRIALEEMLGENYEPYILFALHSSKLMLAIGTDYEYYNDVWVKNEWGRFVSLIASGEKKDLVTCYKNVDPRGMPMELARFPSQDLGKIGAKQDLLAGIDKIMGRKQK